MPPGESVSKRRRGVVLTVQGQQKLKAAVAQIEESERFGQKLTIEELSGLTRLDPGTVSKVLDAEKGVDRRTLQSFFHTLGLELGESDYCKSAFRPSNGDLQQEDQTQEQDNLGLSPSSGQIDWGEAPEVPNFFGRLQELEGLKQWVERDHCRLIAILGMGGMGKTSLAVKLVEQVRSDFEYVIWRSLLNAPPVEEILADWLYFLSDQQETQPPTSLNTGLTRLRHYLKSHRCLLILDNVETILSGGGVTGEYRPGYEPYSQLFEQIGKTIHQSCLLITSREKPKELTRLEAGQRAVKLLSLHGLQPADSKEIFTEIAEFSASDSHWLELTQFYNGNPLGLELAAKYIYEFFDGKIESFLQQGKLVFLDLVELLNHHFERLSAEEREIVYWLAINREPVSIAELEKDIINPNSKKQASNTLQSLQRRWSLEIGLNGFTLQPVLVEYVTDRFVTQIIEEITFGEIDLFNSHAILKAISKDFIRDAQSRLIAQPIMETAISRIGNQDTLMAALKQILVNLRARGVAGYAAGNILNLIRQNRIDLSGFDFSALPIRQAFLQGVTLHDVNFADSSFADSTFTQTFGAVLGVKCSPNGEVIATGNANGEVHLWSVQDGQHLLTCRGHSNWVRQIIFSSDGQMLVTASEDHTIRLWNLKDGSCLRVMRGHDSIVRSIAFSPDGQLIASASDDQTIRFWKVQNGECLKILTGHSHWVLSVSFSPDGKQLASGGCDQKLRIWDVQTGNCLQSIDGHEGWIVSVAYSPNGQRLASAGFDHTIRVWDSATVKCLNVLRGHTHWIWSISFSPDSSSIVSGGADQTVRIWDASKEKSIQVLHGHENQIWAVDWHPEGQKIVSVGDDQAIRIWDVNDGKSVNVIRGYTNWIRTIAFSKDGQTLISGGEDKVIRVWNIHNQQCIQTLEGHENSILCVSLSPDGQKLASGSSDRTIKIWDLVERFCCYTLVEHTDIVWSVAFSPDGQYLASGSFDSTIRIWDAYEGRCIHTLEGYADKIGTVRFNPDSSMLAAVGGESTIKLWNAKSGKLIKILEGHTSRVKTVAFSPDGQLLASGAMDNAVKLWRVSDGKCLHTLNEHVGGVLSTSFSPDGDYLATGSCDQTIKIWSTQSYQCINTLKKHKNWVWSVVFSPSGNLLSSAGEDELICLWNPSDGECLAIFRTKRPYEGMIITGATGLALAQKKTLLALGAIEEMGGSNFKTFL